MQYFQTHNKTFFQPFSNRNQKSMSAFQICLLPFINRSGREDFHFLPNVHFNSDRSSIRCEPPLLSRVLVARQPIFLQILSEPTPNINNTGSKSLNDQCNSGQPTQCTSNITRAKTHNCTIEVLENVKMNIQCTG